MKLRLNAKQFNAIKLILLIVGGVLAIVVFSKIVELISTLVFNWIF